MSSEDMSRNACRFRCKFRGIRRSCFVTQIYIYQNITEFIARRLTNRLYFQSVQAKLKSRSLKGYSTFSFRFGIAVNLSQQSFYHELYLAHISYSFTFCEKCSFPMGETSQVASYIRSDKLLHRSRNQS